jgi:hypothetical protein
MEEHIGVRLPQIITQLVDDVVGKAKGIDNRFVNPLAGPAI